MGFVMAAPLCDSPAPPPFWNDSIDSVKITIEENYFMCMGSLPIDTEYSDNSGGYTFEFIPKKDHSYPLILKNLAKP